jgi:hypothetical protein
MLKNKEHIKLRKKKKTKKRKHKEREKRKACQNEIPMSGFKPMNYQIYMHGRRTP